MADVHDFNDSGRRVLEYRELARIKGPANRKPYLVPRGENSFWITNVLAVSCRLYGSRAIDALESYSVPEDGDISGLLDQLRQGADYVIYKAPMRLVATAAEDLDADPVGAARLELLQAARWHDILLIEREDVQRLEDTSRDPDRQRKEWIIKSQVRTGRLWWAAPVEVPVVGKRAA